MTDKNKNLFQCGECGLHYKDNDIAKKCEEWCKKHKTCNTEIIIQSEENKLARLEKKSEEYLNGWKRERADFLNYKKDEIEKISQLIKYANENLILKILPILDNIHLAEKELPEEIKKESPSSSLDTAQDSSGQTFQAWKVWIEGFSQIKKQLQDFMQKQGIEEIKTIGKKFDPNFMEIAEEVERKAENKEQETGAVVEEIQKGYTLHGKLIRPAKVKISK